MTHTPENLIDFSTQALDLVREQTPLVQCITNSVVTNFTANVLLALGAAPAMVDIPTEAGPFAQVASGVLINLGTPHAEPRQAMLEAVASARKAGTPWVLDPVAVGALPVRTELGFTLVKEKPAIIRGNASEIIAVAGDGAGGRGVDAADDVDSAASTALDLACTTQGVVAVSGPVDLITDGHEVIRLANGHALLTQITGGGCALGAVIAAFASVNEDRLATTVAAVSAYTVAAEIAAESANGPGSFAVNLLDALASLDAATLATRAKVSVQALG